MHLAPTASKRIYQQRVGRVTRRHQGKEAGIVVDFVHPATKHDDPVVTLHSLLDRDVYRGGAIVVGPVRRGRGRRLRVERRVLPVTSEENRRIEVFERELWRIAVEHLDYGEQVQWAALAGARVAPNGWRRARAMLHFDQGGELKRTFLITAVDRNKNPALRLRALQEIASGRDAEAFDRALDFVESWPRDDKREGVKVVLQALAEKKIGRRDQANNWIWRCANMTREVHEEYAVQRWPETKRLLGLLVNSSGGAHARNARRLVQASRQQDRRLSAALLAAALPHTAEAGEVINGARTRMSRKPAALARELLRNFPKGRGKAKRRRTRRKGAGEGLAPEAVTAAVGADTDALDGVFDDDLDLDLDVDLDDADEAEEKPVAPRSRRNRRRRPVDADPESGPRRGRSRRRPASAPAAAEAPEGEPVADATSSDETPAPRSRRSRRKSAAQPAADVAAPEPTESDSQGTRRPRRKPAPEAVEVVEVVPKPARSRRKPAAEPAVEVIEAAPKPARSRRKPAPQPAADSVVEVVAATPKAPARRAAAKPAPKRAPRRTATTAEAIEAEAGARRTPVTAEAVRAETGAPKARTRRKPVPAAEQEQAAGTAAVEPPKPSRRKPSPAVVSPALDAPASAVVEPKPRARRKPAATEEASAPAAKPKPKAKAKAKAKPAAKRKPPAASNGPVANAAAAVEVAVSKPKPRAKAKPAAKRKPRAKKPAAEGSSALEAASERVRAAVEDAA
jgi:hypothetical protein